jgi:uncharacterized protein YkwD
MARAVALSGTALLAAALLAWAPRPTAAWDQSSAEATLWQLLNGDRVNNGLQPLIQHGTLVSLAQWRSKDMIDRNYFSHTILGTSYQVYHWYDSNGLSWTSGGENIGWNAGYADADSPVAINDGFMNSAGHRANILNTTWSHGGVGAYAADGVNFLGELRNPRVYTELFIKLKDAAPPPPPPPPPPATPKPTAKPTAAPPSAPAATPVPETPTPSPTPDPPTPVEVATASPPLATDHSAVANDGPTNGATQPAVGSLRIETAAAIERGIFETVIGSLLSFFLG